MVSVFDEISVSNYTVKGSMSTEALHQHCERCYSLQCQAPVNTSVSCVVIKCHLHCGAAFHKCKEEEHQLLCPNEMVPCLNVDYGCHFTMHRHRLAKHLEVCPASTVICSQQWIRFPVEDTDSSIYRTTLVDPEKQLNVSMALRDQELLFRCLKMKNVFPELMEKVEAESAQKEIDVGVTSAAGEGCSSLDPSEAMEDGYNGYGDGMELEKELSQEEREALAKNKDVLQNYSSYETMFRKEMKGCQQTVKNMEKKLNPGDGEEEKAFSLSNGHGELDGDGSSKECQENGASARAVDVTRSGLAPWQDGVMERLRREVTPADYNMYLVHHGAMLINFGQLAACTPRDKDFVYGKLEPIEVQSVRTFNVPTSYRPKRIHMRDPWSPMVNKSVDTSDLGVSVEDLPKCDEVNATLLCFLEKELKGHNISEGGGADGFYVHIGTQTYNIPSAPFKPEASLADIITDTHKGLYVQIQAEDITRRHNFTNSAFSYLCGHVFRRDEYHTHFKNVHLDIQSCLNGWFEQRCPLAYLGCNYSQSRFHPAGQRATVTYRQDLSTFSLKPEGPSMLSDSEKTISITSDRKHPRKPDLLSRLPFEILHHLAGFLDSFSLSQLSQVSQLMREVCVTLLEERGMVYLKWEKKTSHGGSSWKCRKHVWKFSSLFSKVDRWCFDDVPSMSEHLKVCPFYQREELSKPVKLASMEGDQRERPQGLLDLLQECDLPLADQ
ncbi:F-box only protein 40 [Salvelinus fontinalis]|uniref:F-box only protein 40 n=1 Tax=Salvelinus fontinalis TaxID=8038 RepID=UPI002485FA12|nr:F-box only protein 40 [Salvelinus fontinalis]